MSYFADTPNSVRHELARNLAGLLADTYTLYFTTQVYHWNVEGPMFHSLHQLFMDQYSEMALANDEIAERIRALGFYTPINLVEMQALSALSQPDNSSRTAEAMLEHVIAGHEKVLVRIQSVREVAEKDHDQVSLDLVNARSQIHEKALWMLKSQLGKSSRRL